MKIYLTKNQHKILFAFDEIRLDHQEVFEIGIKICIK